jgi:hypothetical protein
MARGTFRPVQTSPGQHCLPETTVVQPSTEFQDSLFSLYHTPGHLKTSLARGEYLMPQNGIVENRSGQRYVHAFPIRAEWDTNEGAHVVAEGETENVGPDGTLVYLQRELPPVGGRVSLRVLSDHGETLAVVAEVLRIERNPARPQAALQVLGETDEWRGLVWEEAGIKMSEADNTYDEDDY